MTEEKNESQGKYARLIKHFAFYGEYHANPTNQWIHIVCVPLIFTTALIFLSAWDLSSSLPASFVKVFSTITDLPLTAAVPATALYMAFYLYLVPSGLGAAAATLMLAQLGLSAWFRHELPGRAGMALAVIIHVVAWIAQFYGHGVHEKRSPALIDNLFQAIFMAPLFVFIEVLFKLGWLKDLKKAVQPLIRDRIRAYRHAKGIAAAAEPAAGSGRAATGPKKLK